MLNQNYFPATFREPYLQFFSFITKHSTVNDTFHNSGRNIDKSAFSFNAPQAWNELQGILNLETSPSLDKINV